LGSPTTHPMKYLIAAAVVVILCVGIFEQRSSHVWHRYRGGDVLRDGNAVAGSRLFKTREGAILIDLGNHDEWYAYYSNDEWLGYCNQPRGVSLFGVVYVARDETLPCVNYSPVKAEEPHLDRTDDYVEFDSRKGGRIRVVWHRT